MLFRSVSLEVAPGCIHGLIGENGAGKTTLIQCIVGIYKSDQGEVFIDGKSVWENDEAKQMIGYVADRNQFLLPLIPCSVIQYRYFLVFDITRPFSLHPPFSLEEHKQMSPSL